MTEQKSTEPKIKQPAKAAENTAENQKTAAPEPKTAAPGPKTDAMDDLLWAYWDAGRQAGKIPTLNETLAQFPNYKGARVTVAAKYDFWTIRNDITPLEAALREARTRTEKAEAKLAAAEETLKQYRLAYAYVRAFGHRSGVAAIWEGTYENKVEEDAKAGERLLKISKPNGSSWAYSYF